MAHVNRAQLATRTYNVMSRSIKKIYLCAEKAESNDFFG